MIIKKSNCMTKCACLIPRVRLKSIIILGTAILFKNSLNAQSIHFNYTDGTDASYNLEDVQNINFDADLMNLQLLDGTVFTWNTSIIESFQYYESSVNVQDGLNNSKDWNVVIYPNPLYDNLTVIYNLPKEDDIIMSLVDMQGSVILQISLGIQMSGKQQQTLDVSSLPKGTYLCRIKGQQQIVTKTIVKK
jgi:hypothetical protein